MKSNRDPWERPADEHRRLKDEARAAAHDSCAYDWACEEQGYDGTYAEWLALSREEREQYKAGARGEGTV